MGVTWFCFVTVFVGTVAATTVLSVETPLDPLLTIVFVWWAVEISTSEVTTMMIPVLCELDEPARLLVSVRTLVCDVAVENSVALEEDEALEVTAGKGAIIPEVVCREGS